MEIPFEVRDRACMRCGTFAAAGASRCQARQGGRWGGEMRRASDRGTEGDGGWGRKWGMGVGGVECAATMLERWGRIDIDK